MSAFGLTARQHELLGFLEAKLAGGGICPSYQEIGAAIGANKSNVCRLLNELRQRGLVDWLPKTPRSLRLLPFVPVAPWLPGATAQALARFCAEHGEDPAAVIADAVLLHLDELDGGVAA